MAFPELNELELLHNNICRALGDPRRIQILYALDKQSLHVTGLAEALDIPQPTVSRHLSTLRHAGLVSSQRDGASVVYSLADARIIDILNSMRSILRDALDRRARIMD